jgi:hypothetical protein
MEPEMGTCYECSTKKDDSSLKKVTLCEDCKKWFCEIHAKPRIPYFADWNTVFDVQGNPRIKALFHLEHNRTDGHPDLGYLRKMIESFNLEEKVREEMIAKAIDRMMDPEKYVNLDVDSNVDRTKRVEILENEERELTKQQSEQGMIPNEEMRTMGQTETITLENKYGCRFIVPIEVYSNAEYREYPNYAQTMKSVGVIVDEYYRKYGKRKNWEKSPKKSHWWQ